MKQMWSPWRSVHINRVNDNQNEGQQDHKHESVGTDNQPPGTPSVFSRLVKQNKDSENLILWRGTSVFVIMNLYPYNNGHLLIVPYREVAQYEDLTRVEMHEMAQTINLCIRSVKEVLKPDGINIGMNLGKAAGAGIPDHLHMHIVPRWSGDTNFMPTIAEIKVIPESLNDTYNKLRHVMEGVDLSNL